MNFFEKLLPEGGYYCVAELTENRKFRHRFFDTLDDVVQNLTALDAQGKAIYLAQSSFNTQDNRKQENAKAEKAFWLDIDCGEKAFAKNPGHAYPTQRDAVDDLKRFCEESAFPFPCVLTSGNGLYAYWFIQEEIPEPTWRGLALLLKQTLEAYAFKADPARTADSSSVLRPPGTTNRKDPTIEKPVRILKDAEPMPLAMFQDILRSAAQNKKVQVAVLHPPRKPRLNAVFAANQEYPDSSALLVAEECAQLRLIKDKKGDVSEPIWYAGIGVLRFCTEGNNLIHDWSSGYTGYSYDETEQKIEQNKIAQTGPTSCHKFGEVNPQGCIGCTYCNKIVSPIQLGVPKPAAEVERIVNDEGEEVLAEKEAPHGFTRAATGLWFAGPEKNINFCNYDLWVESFQHDESLSGDTLTIKHAHPIDGVRSFTFRAALLDDNKAFSQTLHDNGVYLKGSENKKVMVEYVESYIEALKKKFGTQTLFCQMGWKEDPYRFVLGNLVFEAGKDAAEIGFARNVPPLIQSFKEVGDIEKWADLTNILDTPEMTPYAFVLLAGGLGAPLLKFTGYAGAVLSMVGTTGIGKTVMLRWINSIYGDPEKLLGLRDDTINTIISRLGVFGSIPYTMDEVSNIDPMDLSNFIYRVTQGRDKGRLGQDARERKILNSWNTVATVTSNHSLIEKLGLAKADAGAEINRVFEVLMKPTETMTRTTATNIWRELGGNYGGVAKLYVQYLLDHANDHRGKLDLITAEIDRRTGASPDERFWSAIAACAIYSGLIAKSLGLIKFSITPILDWICEYIPTMREAKRENTTTPINALATFIDANSAKILPVRRDKNRNEVLPMMEMRGDIVGRFELDGMRLYISKDELKKYCSRNFISMKSLAESLKNTRPQPALLSSDCSKVLGAGIVRASISQKCWCIDMSCPELGYIVVGLVKKTTEEGERRVAV